MYAVGMWEVLQWRVAKPAMLWITEKTGRKVPHPGGEWRSPQEFREIEMPNFLFCVQEIILVWKIAYTRKDSPGLQALRHLGWSPGQKRRGPRDKFLGICLVPWAAEAPKGEDRKGLEKQREGWKRDCQSTGDALQPCTR